MSTPLQIADLVNKDKVIVLEEIIESFPTHFTITYKCASKDPIKREEVMQEYVKEKTAQESFLELADNVREGEFAVKGIGPSEIDSEGRHRVTIDFIEMPKTIKMTGYYKAEDLKDALVTGIDTKGHAFGKIHMSLSETAAATWDKFGKNTYPGNKGFNLKLKE